MIGVNSISRIDIEIFGKDTLYFKAALSIEAEDLFMLIQHSSLNQLQLFKSYFKY